MKEYVLKTSDPMFVKSAVWLSQKLNLNIGPPNYEWGIRMALAESSDFREEFMRSWWIEFGSLLYIPENPLKYIHIIWPHEDSPELTMFLLQWS